MAEYVVNYENYLREENVGPEADDTQPILEKMLDDRTGNKYTTVEDWLDKQRKASDVRVVEKLLNDTEKFRKGNKVLRMPAISEAVARIEAERRKEFKSEGKKDWTNDLPDQNGALPKWPKAPAQHDHIVLPNDPRRFETEETKPLIGDITIDKLSKIACRIKDGDSAEYDVAIAAILKEAEGRDLTAVEEKTIVDLKIARTKSLVK